MSENDPIPSKQTSSIPLKKETVRVTLKAADAPPASPSAAIPSAPPVRPPTPTAPPVPGAPPIATAPAAPTVGGAPRPPAATIPLKTAGAPIPRPAPTIALKAVPSAPASPTGPARPGLPGAAAGGSTISLPKATVQLQPPTGAVGGALPSQRINTLSAEEEEEAPESSLTGILAGVGFVAALALLFFQLSIANSWVSAEDNPKTGQWGQLFE